ncbi:pyruvate dehydrogenase phosphatase regulatory subunit, mitochondrial-like isoform X2 [Callorhinus ursinus]|uniref:pyruvate dehydrogenase phosphatase regulatory subunit, mitochondrial-like isoform X2 n=1 Tax=Callorhinus ursinus TaxID=34884 RepID=UPI003CD01B4F
MSYRLLSVVRRQRTGRGWQNWSSGRSGASAAEAHSVALPAQAQVVICGGGIMGTSVAYHLSKMGWKDIVLLEQGRLAAGSTRFCAGILSTARHLTIEQKMADYSNKLYHQLEQETGIQTDGDSGDPEVGELPRNLHPRHEVHHGRVSFSSCAGGNELCWPFIWWRGWKVLRGG